MKEFITVVYAGNKVDVHLLDDGMFWIKKILSYRVPIDVVDALQNEKATLTILDHQHALFNDFSNCVQMEGEHRFATIAFINVCNQYCEWVKKFCNDNDLTGYLYLYKADIPNRDIFKQVAAMIKKMGEPTIQTAEKLN